MKYVIVLTFFISLFVAIFEQSLIFSVISGLSLSFYLLYFKKDKKKADDIKTLVGPQKKELTLWQSPFPYLLCLLAAFIAFNLNS
jgi:hypothetical protein